MNTADLYNQIQDAGVLFNVRRERMFSESGAISSKYGIINESSNEVIGIVGEGYKMVTNEEVVQSMLASFETAKTDLTDARVSIRTNKGGARAMIDIVLPAYSVLADANRTELKISTLNSYDGAWGYKSRVGGIRVACLNGNIFGKIIGSYSSYHNSKLDVQVGADRLVHMIGDFSKSEEWFEMLMARQATLADLKRIATKFFNIPNEELIDYKPYKKLELLCEAYFTEFGRNMYAIYNCYTDFITHKKRGARSEATSLVYAENKFVEILNSSKLFA